MLLSYNTVHLCYWLGLLYVFQRAYFSSNNPIINKENNNNDRYFRWVTAVFYVPFVTGSAIYFSHIWQIFITLMAWQALGEYNNIIYRGLQNIISQNNYGLHNNHVKTKKKYSSTDNILQIIGVLHMAITYMWNDTFNFSVWLSFCLFIILAMIEFLYQQSINIRCMYSVLLRWLAFMWIIWPLSHGIKISQLYINDINYGGGFIVIALLTSWLGDAMAMYIGKRYGSYKIMTKISPNKSLQGMIATIISCTTLCYILKCCQINGWDWLNLPPLSTQQYIIMGIIIGIGGILGDMWESFIKRLCKVKDSGCFFPGHGGVLDRFDGFLIAGPLYYYYVKFII